jgi:DNA-binding SARP family transcriptional activator
MQEVTIRLLGPVEVAVDGDVHPVSRRQVRAIVAVLGIAFPGTVSSDTLIDRVWGEQLPRRPRHALHVYVNRLRDVHGAMADAVETVECGYRFDGAVARVDTQDFAELTRAGGARLADDPDAAARLLDQALQLWRGPAFGDLHYEEYAAAPVRKLDELRIVANEDRCDAWIRTGRAAQAIPELLETLATHPLRERPVSLLIEALRRTGRPAEAHSTFRDYCTALRDACGLSPSPALRALVAGAVA